MATDLRHIWFLAIRTADSFELNRLLFTTPSPSAGIERLSWTLPADFEARINLSDIINTVDCGKSLGQSISEINGLEYAVINWLADKSSSPRFDVIRTLVSVTPLSMLNHRWGDENTVMHLAAISGDKKLYRMLSDKGADSSLANSLGISARQLADQFQISLPPSMSPAKKKSAAAKSHSSHISSAPYAATSATNQTEDEEQRLMVSQQSVETKPTNEHRPSPSPSPRKLNHEDESGTELSNVERIKMQLKSKQRKVSFGTLAVGKINKGPNESPISRLTVKEIKDSIGRRVDADKSASPVRSQVQFDDIFSMDEKESQAIAQKIMKTKNTKPANIQVESVSAETLPVKEEAAVEKIAAVDCIATDFIPPPKVKDFVSEIISSQPVVEIKTTAEVVEVKPFKSLVEEGNSPAKPAPKPVEKDLDAVLANDSVAISPIIVDYSKLNLSDSTTAAKVRPVTLVLSDEPEKPRPASPKKNVQFGNSWKGTLEINGDSSSIRVPPKTARASLTVDTFNAPTKPAPFGKLLMKLKSLQGLAIESSRLPASSILYCVVTAGLHSEPIYTKPIPCCSQIMNTEVPLNEEFGFFIANHDDLITIELRVRMEVQPKPKFNAKQLLRTASVRNLLRSRTISRHFNGHAATMSSNNSQTEDKMPLPIVHEETISRIQIHLADLMERCKDQVLERSWSWEVEESMRNRSGSSMERPGSRFSGFSRLNRSSSRLMEAGNYLKSKLQSHDPASILARGQSLCEVKEAGTLGMQLYYVSGLSSMEEAAKVPIRIQSAHDWMVRKQWVNTNWYSGFLSQQGGDVSSWRRRFFKLIGSQMDAYHEFNMEYRTTIDLTQVTELQALPLELDADVYPTMNSFRLRFKHDEFIDFYADNDEDFAKWTSALRHVLRNMPTTTLEEWEDKEDSSSTIANTTLIKPLQNTVDRKPALKQIPLPQAVSVEHTAEESSDEDVTDELSLRFHQQIQQEERVHKVVMHGIPAFGQTVQRKAPTAHHVGVFGSRH